MTDPLDTFRRAAKTLKSTYEAGDLSARARINAQLPRSRSDLKHADFLHVIARENTYATWPDMKEAVQYHGLDRAGKVQRLKVALAHGQTGVAAGLLRDVPDLADGHFGLLCALYDVDGVRALLSNSSKLAMTPAGPVLPLVHLCRSRMFKIWPERHVATVEIAELLLSHGADVNTGSLSGGQTLSPLYWALGYAGNMTLAKWLLENGANPNDGESLYHATELGHAEGVELLVSFGADPKHTNALPRALDFDNAKMVKILLMAGADPNEGTDNWREKTPQHQGVPALHHAARRINSGGVVDVLLEHGADPHATWNGQSAYAFAKVFGNTDLATRIEARGDVPALSDIEGKLAVAATGTVPDGFVDPAKLPEAYRSILREILHLPNKLAHLKALVAIGLETDRPDGDGITPAQAAGWAGLPDVLAYFLSLDPDLSHVNTHGGTLLSTIIHGSENNPDRSATDYIGCVRMVLEHGVALPRKTIEMAGDDSIRAFLSDWAKAKPGQVVAHGIV